MANIIHLSEISATRSSHYTQIAKVVTDRYYGMSGSTQQMGLTVLLDRYVTIDGIKMPRQVVREPNWLPEVVRRDIEYARYKFNVGYEESIFDYPMPKKVKSSDWKPRRTD